MTADLSSRAARYQPFSLLRLRALCGNTLTELTRLRVFCALLLFALVLIGSSTFLARMTFQQEFQVLKDIALGAMSLFISLMAIVTTARLLPQEIEDRTVYTILAKPVPRYEYVLGKFAGVLVLLAISLIVMALLFAAVLYAREQAALAAIDRQTAGAAVQEIAAARQAVRNETFTGALFGAIALIYMKGAVLAAMTLLLSTLASSTVFTILVSVFAYFIGHLQGIAREVWLHEQGVAWWGRVFLAVVAVLFPDLQQFALPDDLGAGAAFPQALVLQTCGLGLVYMLMYVALAIAVFSGREL